MNRTEVEGVANNIAGKAEQVIGTIGEDAGLKLRGAAREAAGKVQQHAGDAVDAVRGFTERKPFGALALGVGIGVLIGSLLARRDD